MADETRRSGRATKGQHRKNDDELEPKKKSKGGRPKKKAEPDPDPDPEPEEEGPAIIRCICGYVEEDENDQRAMICCDKCQAWQHNVCMGLPVDDEEIPEEYFCEQCRPKDHQELLAGMARGEKPWLERQAQHQREEEEEKKARKKKGKKAKKGKQTATGDKESATPVPQPAVVESSKSPVAEKQPETGQKRKAPAADLAIDVSSPVQSNKRKATSPKDIKLPVPPSPRRQSTVETHPPARKDTGVVYQAELVENIADLQNSNRQKAAKGLEKLFIDATDTAMKQGTFKVVTGQSKEEFGLKLALKVEYALYLNLWGHGAEPNPHYGEKLRMMLHNVKANPLLRDQLLNGFLGANQFSQMSSFEMASNEKKAEHAKALQRTEKQHILVQDDSSGPRIRRTHKGDEVITDDSNHLAAETVTYKIPRRRESQGEKDAEDDGDGEGAGSPHAVELPDDIKSPTSARPLTVDTNAKPKPPNRKSSSNFDINNVWSNVDSPTANREQPSSTPHDTPGPQVKADPEIDAMLKDEEEDEPYSPMEYVMEPGTIWRGDVVMPVVASFQGSAKFVAGHNPSDVHPWDHLMPSALNIEGRIDTVRASAYICGLQYSKTTNVTIVSITPSEHPTARQQFDKLFAYFTQRNRYGVISQNPVKLVRDTYVVPLEAGDSPRPEFMDLLDECEVPATGRQTRCLLVVYVIKVRADNVPESGSTLATPRQPDLTSQSPMSAIPQHMSPVQSGFGTPGQAPPPAFTPTQHQTPNQPPPAISNYTQHSQLQHTNGGGIDPTEGKKGWEAARMVLGPELVTAPSIAQLLQSAPDTGSHEFKIIKGVMEQVPETRLELNKLIERLQERMARS